MNTVNELFKVELLTEILLVLRLWTISGRPASFLTWAVINLMFSATGMILGISSPSYYNMFIVLNCLNVVLLFFVTRAVFEPVYLSYPGLRILGRKTFIFSVLLAIAAAALALPITFRWWSSPLYQCVAFPLREIERCSIAAYAGFLISMYWRLRRLPIEVESQTVAHFYLWSILLVGMFATDSISLFVHGKRVVQLVNTVSLFRDIGLNLGWTILFSRFQHAVVPRRRPEPDPAVMDKLIALNSLRYMIEESVHS